MLLYLSTWRTHTINVVKKMKNKKNNYKELHVNIQQLISARELEDIEKVAASLMRKLNRKQIHENKNHKDDK